ncbi:membrane protein [Streptococcus pneumoniae]|nr:membrane protein [Streptococcus pneumoniae]
MLEQIIQSLFIIVATGLILLVLYQIAKILGSLFVI